MKINSNVNLKNAGGDITLAKPRSKASNDDFIKTTPGS